MPTAELPVDSLQRWLRDNHLQGVIVPSSDEYQNEYVPACARRLHWVTGFSGSAGRALVLQNRAALFVDGRYTTQAKQQAPAEKIEVLGHQPEVVARWLAEHLEPDSMLGFDPRLHTRADVDGLREQLGRLHASLFELTQNPVDSLWRERPDPVATPVIHYPLDYAGLSSEEKRARLGERMLEAGFHYYLATAPEEVAWLLNVRAGDLPTVPVPLSYALLAQNGAVQWFIDEERVPLDSRFGAEVSLQPPAAVDEAIHALDPALCIGLNLKRTPYHLVQLIDAAGAEMIDTDLVEMEKAKKNPREVYGALAAQKHDCLAVIRFLCWLEAQVPGQAVTELDAAEKITELRRRCGAFLGVSFDPISAAGPNSALAHYQPSEQTNRPLNGETIYLIDSGGQYYGGTTDITRTLALQAPSRQQKRAYTLVLKGHIALAMCRFPAGTSGSQLDVLARQYLWQQGMDYGHGTGHGVGSYLSVHEGPASIRPQPNATPLCEGMILSNEPGYYQEGNYGIRIENLVVVKKSELSGFLEFETISHVPMDHKLVEFSLLSEREKGWLKRYHCEIKTRFPPELSDEEKQWLADAIEPFIEL